MLTILDESGAVIFESILISATPSGSATTTDSPVEQGTDTADHVQPQSEETRIQLAVSDTGLGLAGPSPGLSAQTYDFLDQLRRNPQRVDILTTMRTYRSMVLISLSAPYTPQTGMGLVIDTGWREQRVTASQTTGVPASILAAAVRSSGKGKGKKPTATRNESGKEKTAREKSLLKGLKDALTGGK